MAKASDNVFPRVVQGMNTADQAAPSDSSWRVYAKANGIFARSSNGIVGPFASGAGGGVATDTIWDAAGDLAVGTGADTAAKLTLGASGKAPFSNGSTLVYAFPPGYELSYVEKTTNTTISATTEGTANTIVTAASVTYDGTPVLIEFYGLVRTGSTTNHDCTLVLWDDTAAASIGLLSYQQSVSAQLLYQVVTVRRRITPAAGARVYSIRAYSGNGDGQIAAGAAGAGTQAPAFIRITKV